MSLQARSGREHRRPEAHLFDVVVIGSGPAGAASARALAQAGLSVVVLEEGPLRGPADFHQDGFRALADLYRDLGGSLTRGPAPMPYLQARVVGGTSVVNGAISWRLPEDVVEAWRVRDPGLAPLLEPERLERVTDEVEAALGVAPTDPAVAGPKNLLLARGAEALGWAHRPIRRNVRGCPGSGRCLQGCPHGAKQSMERTFLPEACRAGAVIHCDTRAASIEARAFPGHARLRAVAVNAVTADGVRQLYQAREAVVVAASAVHSPLLLWRSGLRQGPVGEHFQCHPGLSVAGEFAEPVRMWEGATQGHEVTGLRGEGVKIEALGYDLSLVATRLKGVGVELGEALARVAHQAHWGAAIRAKAEGRVRPGWGGRPSVRYRLTPEDLRTTRRGALALAELFFAAGATAVYPGIFGLPERVTDLRPLADLVDQGPTDPRAFTLATTHLFGTCRAGSDPLSSVVDPTLRHHATENLYVTDSAVFPSNLGVNPQIAILALATLASRDLAGRLGAAGR